MKFLGQYKPPETPAVCTALCTAQSVRLTDPTLTSRGCVREGIGTVGTKTDRKLDMEVGSSCVEAHGPRWEDKLAEGGEIQRNYGIDKRGSRLKILRHPWEPYPSLTWSLKCLVFSICVIMSLLGISCVWGTGYSQVSEHTQL